MAQESNDRIARLVEQAKRGDREAFSEIVKLVMNRVVALTYRITGNRETALDLAQDTLITAWERLEQFRGESSFLSWLMRIATNRSLNHLSRAVTVREQGVDPVTVEQISVSTSSNPEKELEGVELQQSVQSFMSKLPTQQRIAFELRFYQQFSFDEIAGVTGKALGTVKTNYRESIKKLRVWMKDKGHHS